VKTFQLTVEKRLYQIGTIEIVAESSEEAEKLLSNMMAGEVEGGEILQTNDPNISWRPAEYEGDTFDMTGDDPEEVEPEGPFNSEDAHCDCGHEIFTCGECKRDYCPECHGNRQLCDRCLNSK